MTHATIKMKNALMYRSTANPATTSGRMANRVRAM